MRREPHDRPRAAARRRPDQQGSVLIVALLALISLLSVSAMAVLTVRTGSRVEAAGRLQRVATYAAQSAVAVSLDYLRGRCDPTTRLTDTLGDKLTSGQGGIPAMADANGDGTADAGFTVYISNNSWDPSGRTDTDADDTVLVQAEGYALLPGGTRAGPAAVILAQYRHPDCNDLRVGSYGGENLNPENTSQSDSAIQLVSND